MKPKAVDRDEKNYPSPPILEYEFLRPTPYKTDFSKIPKHQSLVDKIELDIQEQLQVLNANCKAQGRRPSGQETHAVRLKVRAEHDARYTQTCIKMALWNQSERILRLLRTPGQVPVLESSIQQQRQIDFINQLDLSNFPEADFSSPLYLGTLPTELPSDYYMESFDFIRPDTGLGPNQFFESISPCLVSEFGFPFYTSIKVRKREQVGEKIIGINKDFFAAFLGGQKRFHHDVIFYLPESRFYFYDPICQQYIPTTEDKVRMVLSLTLQDRAWGADVDDAAMVLNQFRSKVVFDEIMAKAKTLLAVERGFFEGPNAKPRFVQENHTANDIANAVQEFIQNHVDEDETSILTISECLAAVECHNQATGLPNPRHRELKVMVAIKIRELYGVGLRNDLLSENNRCVAGWKGLRLDHRIA